MSIDEQELLEGAQRSDPQALHEFVERYKKYVYFLGLNLTGNHHDAEDLSQEVFMKALGAIQRFRGDSKLTSWLHRITVNAYLDQKNKPSFRLLRNGDSFDEMPEIQLPASANSNPEKQFEQRSIRIAIEKALEKLSPRQKTIFVLRHYGELSLKDIAETLKLHEGTVKSTLFHAIQKLQKALEHLQYQEGLS